MTEPRLKARIWVAAYIRKVQAAGAFAAVVRHGDDDAGTVLLKLNSLDGRASVLARGYDAMGTRVWRRATGEAPVPEADADAYLARERGIDPDIWVVEVEDRDGRHFLEEAVH